jgi:hypothetical protein
MLAFAILGNLAVEVFGDRVGASGIADSYTREVVGESEGEWDGKITGKETRLPKLLL